MQNPKIILKQIFNAGLKRVNPLSMIEKTVTLKKNQLSIDTGTGLYKLNLSDYKKIFIIGMGKASTKMAKAFEQILGNRIYKGIVVTKYGYLEKLKYLKIIEAGHPFPDDNSIKAGELIMELLKEKSKDDLVISLISGGASSLICAPYSLENIISLTLAEKQKVNQLLLNCGADIHEINCIRKHISKLKGGRLAELIYPCRSLSLILSDVVGDDLDTIASGLTAPDSTTFQNANDIINKYNLRDKLPDNVLKIFNLGIEGKIPETPKPANKIFKSALNILIGTNHDALISAKAEAEKLGFDTFILTSSLTGESKEAGNFLASIGIDAYKYNTFGNLPVCIIAGGETTVTIKGKGLGGRNQEMALFFLTKIGKLEHECKSLFFLSAGTDGSDGPTDAAGAIASLPIYEKALKLNLDPEKYLAENDSYHFFERTDALFKTGPTGTNVCDIQILLILK